MLRCLITWSRLGSLCGFDLFGIQAMDFQNQLLSIEKSLRMEDLQVLVFLCTDLLNRDLSQVTRASELFSMLWDNHLLSQEKPDLIAELLLTCRLNGILHQLGLDQSPSRCRISPYRKMLVNLSLNITADDLKSFKFMLQTTLSRGKLEKDVTMLELLLVMEKEGHLSCTDLSTLERIIKEVCPFLMKEISQYKDENGPTGTASQETGEKSRALVEDEETGSQYFSLSLGGSRGVGVPGHPMQPCTSAETEMCDVKFSVPEVGGGRTPVCHDITGRETASEDGQEELSHSLNQLILSGDREPNDSVHEAINLLPEDHPDSDPVTCLPTQDLEAYEMRGEKRGFCLIINNYDFSDSGLRDRRGTHVDERSLVDVFEWLGFETLTVPDCSRRRILSLLTELRDRDHTHMDCFVCCVLSHGKQGAVYGVDGKTVGIRELTEPFCGDGCPSLWQKPKLFFIQACQGTRVQRAVPIQADCHAQDSVCSDAAPEIQESLPADADLLLGMATVPDCSSFRDRELGTWYIQSLCRNLRLLVPRGYDLLSILTQVNNDVSRMTDKDSGRKKQIPRPAYTLHKRLIFPIPRLAAPTP